MEFWETLVAKLEANRLKKEALFGIGDKPKQPKAPNLEHLNEPMKLQPSWEGSHGMGGAEGAVNSDGSLPHISDKLDNNGNKIN